MNNLTKSGKILSQVIDLLLGANFTRPIEKEMEKDPYIGYQDYRY
jgi:hypothetical protein